MRQREKTNKKIMICFVMALQGKDQDLHQEIIGGNQRSRYIVKMTGRKSKHCSSVLNKPEKSERKTVKLMRKFKKVGQWFQQGKHLSHVTALMSQIQKVELYSTYYCINSVTSVAFKSLPF